MNEIGDNLATVIVLGLLIVAWAAVRITKALSQWKDEDDDE